MKIVVIFTCFNRKAKTENCICSLVHGNPDIEFEFIVVNDGSTDGTGEMLDCLKRKYKMHHISEYSNLYYSRGMRVGMEYLLESEIQYDAVLMVNDDVDFLDHAIEKIAQESRSKDNSVIVGCMRGKDGSFTYGGVRYLKGIKYTGVGTNHANEKCDTFNANCVFIPADIFKKIPIIDSHYVHGLGDFDYGLEINRRGYSIHTSEDYAGICERNSSKNTWVDKNLPLRQRLKAKNDVKASPAKPWFYFLKKNFGIWHAILYSVTPYVRVFLGNDAKADNKK